MDLIPRAQNPLSYFMNLNTISLPTKARPTNNQA
jgi:hypothetical protein